MINIGQEAPDFELRDAQSKEMVKLSDFRGSKNVMLIFYPLAFSRGCTTEFCSLRDDNPDIPATDDLEVFGISVDSHHVLKAWLDQEKFPVRMLSDFWPHGGVAQAYGVFVDLVGLATRASFLVDKDGIVRWMEVGEIQTPRDQEGWRKALAEVTV